MRSRNIAGVLLALALGASAITLARERAPQGSFGEYLEVQLVTVNEHTALCKVPFDLFGDRASCRLTGNWSKTGESKQHKRRRQRPSAVRVSCDHDCKH